ncbi:DNA-binding response regulator, NarL/FixJ family, contains REC and HTH domains [Duganella sacchari]|uniref:DNA-binding response regulator, NarL/FixJ family, contains REC and HTH domains n=2 Tax=Duganella sacchari TaxID=551987 RepID=A0A1M7QXE4_9BURK|nr:DNA-binding response regulator, NarL/FixJ family, contains REC and HTH domains [Duganella sacchari]
MMLTSAISEIQLREVASLAEAMQGARHAMPPQLILLDVQLPGINGLDGMTLLQRQWPTCPVVVLSADASTDTQRMALQRGAVQVLSKAAPAGAILEAILSVLRAPAVMATPARVNGDHAPRLTARQCEVLDLVCQGLSNKLIGRQLHLSENTVRGHVQALLATLQVSSRAEAAFVARSRGLVG